MDDDTIESIRMHNTAFIGHDGNKHLRDEVCEFSSNFDWVITKTRIHMKCETPRTVYCKTDFLPMALDKICQIKHKFILITGASDYSPQINFRSYFDKIISIPNLHMWFMENKSFDHPKVKSLPVGLGAKFQDELMDVKFVNAIAKIPINKKNRVFCSWKNRTYNDCGEENCIRPKIRDIIRHNNIYEWHESNLPFEEFLNTVSQYEYALCPIGNGLDPAPTCWFCLGLGVIPIIWSTPNSRDLYSTVKDHVIFFDTPDDLRNIELEKRRPLDDLSFLTSQYWAKKINEQYRAK